MNKPDKQVHSPESDLSHSMTHYLLTIHKLKEERGFARVTDIARELNLTKGSVSTAINNLKKKNLVSEEDDCKFLILTDKGHDEVHKILSTRTLMFYFLKDYVGVVNEVADRDSCMMEHLMSQESLEKLFIFMKKLSNKDSDKVEIQTSLDLSNFSTPQDFIESQKGDRYLEG
jgi:DtxR family transcriptional regulator, Mn-dependent transcriptional regulator